ncbi:hypothetical protein D3C73_1294380 [compost metagenome]
MTYVVQNGTVSLPSGQANPVPYVYINGKLIEESGLLIKEGSTHVNASFIREHVDASYAGEGTVALRSAVEGLGASVEFLPAVGESRGAVLIYTK